MNKLLFIHNKPKIFNIGDFLCTPQHYFDFGMTIYNSFLFLKNNQYNVILGGGAYIKYGINNIDKYDKNNVVAWGIGGSKELNDSTDFTINILNNYFLFGTRDITIANDKIQFLPCVSVLNRIVDINAGNKLGVFLNYDSAISSKEIINEISSYCKGNNIIFGTNSMYQREFEELFSKTNKIITNSYHIAYWSLLSGRKVKIIGYSTKFINLLNMFKLDEKDIFIYSRKDISTLKNKFYEALESKKFYYLTNHQEIKNEFRQININYANQLVKNGFLKKAKLIPQNDKNIRKRERKYKNFMFLKTIKEQIRKLLDK